MDHQVEVVPNRQLEDGNQFEEKGLRTDGDDEDHMHEPPMTFNRAMSLVAMAFLWTSSQIPVYLFGESGPPAIKLLLCVRDS